MDIKEYKCPNCSGTVKFESATQKMKCPYCDAEFEIGALDDYQKQMAQPAGDNFGWDTSGVKEPWEDSELGDLSTGACPSCGAELIGDENTIAMVCPCCGNAQIVKKRVAGLLKPEYVLPFQLEKKSAVDALKKFYEGKKLLPNLFKDENRVNGIQGLYVPFWLFNAKARANIQYKATRTSSWSDRNYNYTRTDHYSVVRDGSLGFEKIPVDGSKKMDDAYMDAIEPFDYNKLSGFEGSYLAGYSAEKFDVTADESKDRVNLRIKRTIEMEFARTVTGYASVVPERSTVDIKEGKVSYALLPVWILNTKYQNENYQFIMNGQSGRLVGKLPVDPGKVLRYRILFTGIFGLVFTVIIQLLRLFT